METLTETELETWFARKATLDCAADIARALRDPIVKDDPMFAALKRLSCVKSWAINRAGLAGLERVEKTIVPLVQAYLQRQRSFDPALYEGEIARCDYIPAFNEDGLLPPGQYHVIWQQVVERFACTDRRYRQTQGLLAALLLLQEAGCRQAHVGGSFVTAKPDPGDIDYVYLPEGVDFSRLEPMLNSQSPASMMRRAHFGIDGGAGDLEYVRLHLQARTVVDRSEICLASVLPVFQPLPTSRLVGSLVLDLSRPLPPAVDFTPSCMWDSWHDRMQFCTRV